MSANDVVQNIDSNNRSLQRRSILSSSNPTDDVLPIDCILVYDRTALEKDDEAESNHGQQSKKHQKPSERRRKFEEYLSIKQHLVLERVVSRMKIFNRFR